VGVKDYPNQDVATKVTIHQLLTHTGGAGDFFGPECTAHRLELKTLVDYVALFGKRGPAFEPGSRRAYSNYGMLLLGVVVERVSGQSYYDYVAEHVYTPAGMTRTAAEPGSERPEGGGESSNAGGGQRIVREGIFRTWESHPARSLGRPFQPSLVATVAPMPLDVFPVCPACMCQRQFRRMLGQSGLHLMLTLPGSAGWYHGSGIGIKRLYIRGAEGLGFRTGHSALL
jgi:CubicO group peptidase (beta-lactamase class C family)